MSTPDQPKDQQSQETIETEIVANSNDDDENSCHNQPIDTKLPFTNDSNNCKANVVEAVAKPEVIIKPSWRRFVIIFLFSLNSGNKSFQWIQVAAATTKATKFYQVENYVINVTSIIFLLSFIVLSWPACFIIERIGLRKSILAACFGAAFGSIVKCFSCQGQQVGQDWSPWPITLLLLGQVFVSLSEQLIFSIPPRLASVWFPDKEVSSAVSFCYLGNQIGVALGFLLPKYYLGSAKTPEEIGQGLYQMFLATAGFSVFALVADLLFLVEEPEFAPGRARWRQRQLERSNKDKRSLGSQLGSLFSQIAHTLRDSNLMLLAMSYGFTIGMLNCFTTLLDQMLALVWPQDEHITGNSGFLFVIAGSLGTLVFGRVIDKWHAYKGVNLWLIIGSIFSLLLFSYCLAGLHSPLGVYAGSLLLGLFSTGILASGIEYAIEITYPAPELVTASVVNVTPQILGTIFILIGSHLVDHHGMFIATIFYLLCFSTGLVLLFLTDEQLKRQTAAKIRMSMKTTETIKDQALESC